LQEGVKVKITGVVLLDKKAHGKCQHQTIGKTPGFED
jgi:hypothetical protein